MKGSGDVKQLIPFKKDLIFKTKVDDITSISLEHNLKVGDDDFISGEFVISGEYKMTAASVNKETFSYNIPFDIALDDKYDLSSSEIEITDFYYEIVNNEILRVNIEVGINNLKEKINPEVTFEPKINTNTINNINLNVETDAVKTIKLENNVEEKDEVRAVKLTNMNDLFNTLDEQEKSATYLVYIVKEEDTVESIMTKYSITRDDLSLYNDLETIKIGDKLIIPSMIND